MADSSSPRESSKCLDHILVPTQDSGTPDQPKSAMSLPLRGHGRMRSGHLPIPTPIAETALHWQLDSDGRLVQGEKPNWPDTPAPWDEPNLPSRSQPGVADPLLPDPDRKRPEDSLDSQTHSHRKAISKSDISSPTLISSSFSRATVDLPQGASLKNGMEPYRSLGYRQTPELLFQKSPGFKRKSSWPLTSHVQDDCLSSHDLANNMRKESRFTGFGNWFSRSSRSDNDILPWNSSARPQSHSEVDEELSQAPVREVRNKRSLRKILFGQDTEERVQYQPAVTRANVDEQIRTTSAIWQPMCDVTVFQTDPSSSRTMRCFHKGRSWLRKVRKPKTYVEDVLDHRQSAFLPRK